MCYFQDLKNEFNKVLEQNNISSEVLNRAPLFDIPPELKFGHLAYNGLMIANNKQEIKDQLLKILDSKEYIDKYEIIAPGFINIFFKQEIIEDMQFNIEDIGQNQLINIEYCSPNPTGPLHLGHCRGTILGNALTNLLKKANYNIKSEIYINDQGNQVNQFMETIMHHKQNILNLNNSYNIYYKGDYIKEIAQHFLHKTFNTKDVINYMVKKAQQTLKKLNIEHDIITYESDLYEDLNDVNKILEDKNLTYEGLAENTKEQEANHTQLLLKTKNFGDNEDRVLRRSNGIFTYFAFDIAYHFNKYKRGFYNQICVLGEDHVGHMKKMKIILEQIHINLNFLSTGIVTLKKNGENLAMSKRDGVILTLDEILEIISPNTLKWIIYSFGNNKPISFSLDNLPEDSPDFYFYNAINRLNNMKNNEKQDLFTDFDFDILRMCVFWPNIFELCVKTLDIHKLFSFGYKLAQAVNRLLQNICINDFFTHRYLLCKYAEEILMNILQILNFNTI
jgi:arginyl-tRNA synthetase